MVSSGDCDLISVYGCRMELARKIWVWGGDGGVSGKGGYLEEIWKMVWKREREWGIGTWMMAACDWD